MARPRKPPRLVWHDAYYNKDGSLNRAARWYIEDGGKRISTGCSKGEIAAAQSKLADYLSRRDVARAPTSRPDFVADGKCDRNVPLRLELAARIAFPDGSIGVRSLRSMRDAGHLDTEIIANKEYTTLAAIERMRELCRVRPKVPASSGEKKAGSPTGGFVKPKAGLSKTEESAIAQAAAKLIAQRLKESLRNTSRNATGGRRAPKT